jgi:sigma-54 dependent transcriptional regulator, acetoin dehydrogenase operon transcriptional activator AcoR
MLPPLRQRREDLGLMVPALLARHAAATGVALPAIDAAAARALFLHSWPRNVRELDSCLMASAILAGKDPIQLDHLHAEVRSGAARAAAVERVDDEAVSGERVSAGQLSGPGSRGGTAPGNAVPLPDDNDSGGFSEPVATGPLSDEDRRIRDEVIACLRAHGGNISAVARAMGKDRKQIQRWVKRFDLDPQSFR